MNVAGRTAGIPSFLSRPNSQPHCVAEAATMSPAAKVIDLLASASNFPQIAHTVLISTGIALATAFAWYGLSWATSPLRRYPGPVLAGTQLLFPSLSWSPCLLTNNWTRQDGPTSGASLSFEAATIISECDSSTTNTGQWCGLDQTRCLSTTPI